MNDINLNKFYSRVIKETNLNINRVFMYIYPLIIFGLAVLILFAENINFKLTFIGLIAPIIILYPFVILNVMTYRFSKIKNFAPIKVQNAKICKIKFATYIQHNMNKGMGGRHFGLYIWIMDDTKKIKLLYPFLIDDINISQSRNNMQRKTKIEFDILKVNALTCEYNTFNKVILNSSIDFEKKIRRIIYKG